MIVIVIKSWMQDGSIFLGQNNIVEEQCVITNTKSQHQLQIGHSNHFQVGCNVSAERIGDCNSFGMKSNYLFRRLFCFY